MTTRLYFVTLLFFLQFFALSAESQTRDRGVIFGLSIGRGSIGIECGRCNNVNDISEGLSLTGMVGYRLHPNFALVGEHWTVRYNDRESEWFHDNIDHLVAQHMSTLAGQLWVSNRIWVKAGFGTGWHQSDSPYVKVPHHASSTAQALSSSGAIRSIPPPPTKSMSGDPSRAVFFAAGWEIIKSKKLAIDVQIRVGRTTRPEYQFQILNTALNIGATFF